MTVIDIADFVPRADDMLAGLPSHHTRGPITVTRDGEPEAVIIRAAAWAPSLHHFDHTPDGRVVCVPCMGTDTAWSRLTGAHLAETLDRCNAHWDEVHRPQRARTPVPPSAKLWRYTFTPLLGFTCDDCAAAGTDWTTGVTSDDGGYADAAELTSRMRRHWDDTHRVAT